jgi:DNA polymerase III gamma/tau subunit
MKPEKLSDIKKELLAQDAKQLSEICLRMAKYKKENKELLNYLLFNADDPMEYAEELKRSLQLEFVALQKHYYYSLKTLRKILRVMNRHIKFTASKQVEVEMLLWFCKNFIAHADTRSSHKPLTALFIRQMEKISKTLVKLHEDLQFDYRIEFDALIEDADQKVRNFYKKQFEDL